MTADAQTSAPTPGKAPAPPAPKSRLSSLLRLPGLIAISVYMLLLSAVSVVYVVEHRVGPVYLVFSALFIAGALGLMLLLRWAWALALSTVAILSAMFLFEYFTQHLFPYLMRGLLNLVLFLYLVRTDVRTKLK